MNVLITGSLGFLGRNLREFIRQSRPDANIICYDLNTPESLSDLCKKADFVVHLAGVNRPDNLGEFDTGNAGLTKEVLSYCLEGKKPPVLISSSIQAALDNPYGRSKKAAEDFTFAYGEEAGSPVYVFRLTGIFGKWCRPDYNSVVATFCYNIARGLPIEIRDPSYELSLVYIDDVCRAFLAAMDGKAFKKDGFCAVEPVYAITLGDLAERFRSFDESRKNLAVPDMGDALTRKLYAAYSSYLPVFSYPLNSRTDARGSFTEFLKTPERGQVSVNVAKPGVTKGNHWHHTKTEKFLVVSGRGVIRFRKIGEAAVTEYQVSGEKLEVLDIPTGYVHSITNTGELDLVTVMWADEVFDPINPDTFPESVLPEGV
jgi:UDP-2-acetamido-2,6-beta-L-arabino-hexul-4-ose reductase